MNKKQKKRLIQIIISIFMLIVLHCYEFSAMVKLALYIVTYFIIGHDILGKALNGIKNKRIFDESFLMSVATIGAFALAVYTKSGDYDEAVAVMLFYQIGEFCQSYAVGKSRKNISDLMDIRPDYANIEVDGKLEKVDPDEVEVGSIIVVQPGEKLPIDGIIVEGDTNVNLSALTGESLPVEVKTGDNVLSGSINLNKLIKVKTTKEFDESTVSKILELIENSTTKKAKSEEFIAKFAKIYTPFVCYTALALAVLPPLVNQVFSLGAPNFGVWIYRALTFLVISCPCALVISIPLSFFAGIGGASHEGILIKGANYLETLAKAKIICFDKTGTLTHGVFEVSGIHHNELEDEKLLELAALAESASSHPIGKSLQKAYGKELDRNRVTEVEELSGFGVKAKVDGINVAAGNAKLMESIGVQHIDCHCAGTVIHVSLNNEYAGHILISDIIKQDSKAAIDELCKVGIDKIIMLTGDSQKVAEHVASELSIKEYYSGLLPGDKVSKIQELLEKKQKDDKLVFVGDGINDAPVLACSDVGIAMGAIGSDAAIEAADVVLMNDNPLQIVKAIRISRKCLSIVYQNIVFALVIKFGCLILGALGLANMWAAIFADVGVMLLAVINAMRALRCK